MECRLCRQEAADRHETPFRVAELCADHGRVWEAARKTLTPQARAERRKREAQLDNWQVEWVTSP
jgi:hypothetical protein